MKGEDDYRAIQEMDLINVHDLEQAIYTQEMECKIFSGERIFTSH